MTTTNSSARSLRWVWFGLLTLLLVGLCGIASLFAAAKGLKVTFPGFAKKDLAATIQRVEPAGNGLMRIVVHVDERPPEGNLYGYYAEVNGRRYSCEASAEDPFLLICVGPAFVAGSTVEFRLFNPDDRVVFGTTIALVVVVSYETSPGSGDRPFGNLPPVETGPGLADVTVGSDTVTFSILKLLGLALGGDGGGLGVKIGADADLNLDADAGINADVTSNTRVESAPASSCLLGILCLEVNLDLQAGIDP